MQTDDGETLGPPKVITKVETGMIHGERQHAALIVEHHEGSDVFVLPVADLERLADRLRRDAIMLSTR